MQWQISLEKRAEKDLNKLPRHFKDKILAALPILQSNPYLGKKLEGDHKDLHVYRVWPYRIIYKIYKSYLLIVIINIGHRQGVYK